MRHRNNPDNISIGEELSIGVGALRVSCQDTIGQVLFVIQSYIRLPQHWGWHSKYGDNYWESISIIKRLAFSESLVWFALRVAVFKLLLYLMRLVSSYLCCSQDSLKSLQENLSHMIMVITPLESRSTQVGATPRWTTRGSLSVPF